jgi:hypothetical protein
MTKKADLWQRISDWWNGETKTYDVPGVFGVYTERHWTSDAAHALADFYLRHWQWLWGTAIAIALGILAFAD